MEEPFVLLRVGTDQAGGTAYWIPGGGLLLQHRRESTNPWLAGSGRRSLHTCWRTICPPAGATTSDEINTWWGRPYWNPIKAEECLDYQLSGISYAFYRDKYKMCYNRMLDFANQATHHSFEWDWKNTREYNLNKVPSQWSVIGSDYDTDGPASQWRHTRIRVSRPNLNQVVGDFRAFSSAEAVREYSNILQGEMYLGPEFIVSVLPGELGEDVGGWLNPWVAPAFLVGRDVVTGDHHLYRLGLGTPTVQSVQTLIAGNLDSSAQIHGAVVPIDGALVGTTGGKLQVCSYTRSPVNFRHPQRRTQQFTANY